jgi:hypothetical protein
VDIACAVFGGDFLDKILKIRLDVGIGILLNDQRGRGVAAENRQEAGGDILLAKPARYLRANLDKAFAGGLNVQGMERLAHRKGRRLEAVAMRPAANLPHFEITGAAIFMFLMPASAKSAAAPSFAAKMRTATRRAKKSRSGRSFSSLSRVCA